MVDPQGVAPGRALHANYNGEPWELPEEWKSRPEAQGSASLIPTDGSAPICVHNGEPIRFSARWMEVTN